MARTRKASPSPRPVPHPRYNLRSRKVKDDVNVNVPSTMPASATAEPPAQSGRKILKLKLRMPANTGASSAAQQEQQSDGIKKIVRFKIINPKPTINLHSASSAPRRIPGPATTSYRLKQRQRAFQQIQLDNHQLRELLFTMSGGKDKAKALIKEKTALGYVYRYIPAIFEDRIIGEETGIKLLADKIWEGLDKRLAVEDKNENENGNDGDSDSDSDGDVVTAPGSSSPSVTRARARAR